MKRTCLTVDRLADRINPVVWNNPWADPGHLTLSFAPDGTPIQEAASGLSQELGPMADWQREVLRAFQTWAVQGNINLSLAADAGTPFGSVGPVQGNPARGDIRVGARPLSPDQLAVSTPFDLFGGWGGSVLLNTAHDFDAGGTAGAFDLYTVFLQEAGHTLGLANDENLASAMYTFYQGPRAGLSPTDVTNLQGLYGARDEDRFDGGSGNDRLGDAKELKFVAEIAQLNGTDGTGGGTPFVALGDRTTLTDVDYFKVKLPSSQTSLTAYLRTGGLSLLTAKLTVTTSNGTVLATRTATDPSGGDLTATVSGLAAGGTYYVRVEGATEDVFGIGAYRLAVGAEAAQAVYPVSASGFLAPDNLTNDTQATRTDLGAQKQGADLRWDETVRASIHTAADKDFYKVKSPKNSPGILVVTVWALETGQLDPALTLTNAAGQVLPARVLSNDAGAYTVQLENVASETDYFIKVAATSPAGGFNTGNYFLGVDFRPTAVALAPVAAAGLTQAVPQAEMTVQTYQEHLIHFALGVVSANPAVAAGVRMSVYDAENREVFTVLADGGRTVTGDVLLPLGVYTVVFSGGTPTGIPMPDLGFTLDGLIRSDPIGILPENPAGQPGGPPPPPPPTTTILLPSTRPYTNPYRLL